ncbi:MAG TPA: hypothetical protein VHW71_03755 [Steroidobacteraceae bacterium]|jgi:hypothetical protein|nr:hypothetical protein [Steroidobacteraceae bacterium]
MTRSRISSLLPVLAFTTFCSLATYSAGVFADDPTPPPTPADRGHHRNPAFAACKKQADDQKLARGDARRDFIKNCMKSAPAAPSS